MIWIDEQIKNETNKIYQVQLHSDFPSLKVKLCGTLEKGIKKILESKHRLIFVIISAKLFQDYISKIKIIKNQLKNYPILIIFTSKTLKNILLKQKEDKIKTFNYETFEMVNNPDINYEGVVSSYEEIKLFVTKYLNFIDRKNPINLELYKFKKSHKNIEINDDDQIIQIIFDNNEKTNIQIIGNDFDESELKNNSDFYIDNIKSQFVKNCDLNDGIHEIVFVIHKSLTNFKSMFNNCKGKKIIFINFQTEKVINMSEMFFCCSSIKSLDLSSFQTFQVDNFNSMFNSCISLTSLDISSFKTDNAKTMESMFKGCKSIQKIDISHFNTYNVTSMASMFEGCSSLISLNLLNFNTQNVDNMNWMFLGCSTLTSLDLSSFNTKKVTCMNSMFNWCVSLKNINLSSFETFNVDNMGFMFKDCKSLDNINLSSFNVNNVKNMNHMFDGCLSLTNLDLSMFETESLLVMECMFDGCSSLTNLDISSFIIEKVKNMKKMFGGCVSLSNIKINEKCFEKFKGEINEKKLEICK